MKDKIPTPPAEKVPELQAIPYKDTSWREELAWAAGFFDGEGYISVNKTRQGRASLKMGITQTNRYSLERFSAALGGIGNVLGPYSPPSKPGMKPFWVWQASGNKWKVECPQGHLLSGDNVIQTDGRHCRVCTKAANTKVAIRRKEERRAKRAAAAE